MISNSSVPIFYSNKPVFGLDIGHGSIKIMQITNRGGKSVISCYGYGTFDPKCIKDGVIIDPEPIAKEIHKLVSHNLVGKLSSHRVISAVPVSRSFNRILTLPKLGKGDLDQAVIMEAEQYIPVAVDEL